MIRAGPYAASGHGWHDMVGTTWTSTQVPTPPPSGPRSRRECGEDMGNSARATTSRCGTTSIGCCEPRWVGNLAYRGKVQELLGSRGFTLQSKSLGPSGHRASWNVAIASRRIGQRHEHHAIQHRKFRTSNTLPTETADLGQLFERLAGYPCYS